MSKFTPGPWLLDEYGNVCTDTKNSPLTRVCFSGLTLSGGAEADANTALIADAPALLEALEDLYTSIVYSSVSHEFNDATLLEVSALIAKHRGQP